MSKQKILISGCGLSFSGQERRVWTNILKIAGADIVDVSGPAVSNQWILDQTVLKLLADDTITDVVIQLTLLGKLDVDITSIDQELALVKSDTIRNFTYQGVWPSSGSKDHISKQLWYEYLYSPRLEIQEIFCKIMLIDNWCNAHNIKLTILQGYDINWTNEQLVQIKDTILNLDKTIWKDYVESEFFAEDPHDSPNTVPGLGFQFYLASKLAKTIAPALVDKINYINKQYEQTKQ